MKMYVFIHQNFNYLLNSLPKRQVKVHDVRPQPIKIFPKSSKTINDTYSHRTITAIQYAPRILRFQPPKP